VKRLGFDDSAFHSFCVAQKGSWKGQGVNEFIAHFLKLPGDTKNQTYAMQVHGSMEQDINQIA